MKTRSSIGLILTLALVAGAARAQEDFSGQDLEKRDFSDQDLPGANFEDATLVFAKFRNSTLAGANFKDADLTNADFYAADLQKADFRGSVMGPTFFQTANMAGANFQGVDFKGSNFDGCKMKGANLRGCKGLGGAQNADLRGADLRGAVFTCTSYYLGGCRLQGAKFDKKTRWPKGFDVEASGAVLTASPAKDDGKSKPKKESEDDSDEDAKDKETQDDDQGKDEEADDSDDETPPPPATDDSDDPSEDSDSDADEDDRKARKKGKSAKAAPDLGAKKLSEEIVKHLLETEMWGSKDGKGYSYDYKLLKLAPPRKADPATDGTLGLKKDLIVVAVRVRCDVIHDLGNNDNSVTEKHQDYLFFKDEFGTWSYRFMDNR